MDNDFEIFKGKKFSDLCKDVYKNSSHKRDQIDILINELRTLIKTAGDAVLIVPIIKDYLEVGVKNDEHLIKLAAVVQRFINSVPGGDSGDGGFLSEAEKQQLLDSVQEVVDEAQNSGKSIKKIESRADEVKEDLVEQLDNVIIGEPEDEE